MAKRSLDYVVTDTASVNWTMDNFETFTGTIYSTFFFSTKRFKFGLFMEKKYFTYKSQHIIFYLFNWSKQTFHRFHISLIDANGNMQLTKVYYWDFNPKEIEYKNYPCVMVGFDSFDKCKEYLVNGQLTIKCEVEILEESLVTKNQEDASIINDLNSLLQSGNLSDVTLIVADKEYQAHKAILAARSPVFAAMFTHDCQEKIEGRVRVPDISAEAFEHFLRYIYANPASNKDHSAELLVAADKYQMEHLKAISGDALAANLNVHTAVDVLMLADTHQSPQLKARCMEFIVDNSEEVMATEGWKKLSTRPELLMELFKCQAIKAKPLLKK